MLKVLAEILEAVIKDHPSNLPLALKKFKNCL